LLAVRLAIADNTPDERLPCRERPVNGGRSGGDSVAERMAPAVATDCYRALGAVLEKYVSALLVHSTLRSALAQCGTTPASFKKEELAAVAEQAMVGMRLFCEPARLPDLTRDLAEHCARELG
jgi:hypothetical protein